MYTVTITQTQVEETICGKKWTIVKEEPSEQLKSATHHVYGYTPEITKKKEVERQMFKQVVEELCITDVIAAVNGVMISAHDYELKKLADKASETGDHKDLKAYLDTRKKL